MGLNNKRIASLDALGFDWDFGYRATQSFEDRFEALKAFKAKHGHVNVQYKHDSSLYRYCSKLRNARKAPGKMGLDEGRIASLDALGFDWKLVGGRMTPFEEGVEGLKVTPAADTEGRAAAADGA